MVAVAHQAEHRIVAPEVVGSRPIGHPIFFLFFSKPLDRVSSQTVVGSFYSVLYRR
ncbi:MAG: hypothetical protein RI942_1459 [Pseudomonadota bacterium]